jgi:ferrochelatase
MVTHPENLKNISAEAATSNSKRVAVLLTGYGGVQDYQDFTEYNKRASEYIAAKFAPIPASLYPLVARILAVRDLFKWGYKHDHFTSPQNDVFEQQRAGIEQHLQERWGDAVQIFSAFYFCEPFVEQVVAEIQQQGFQQILIYPLLVVNSVFTSSIAVEQLNEVIRKQGGEQPRFTDLRYIPSFADRPAYIDLMVRQVKEKINADLLDMSPSQIGIVLLVHGGPQKSKGLVTGVEQGQQIYDRVQEQLVNHYPLISIAWINHKTPFVQWSKPTMKQAAKNLIDLGAKVLLFKPIGWATENYETILEPEEAIASLHRHHAGITYIRLGCANAHPEFLQMAADWANPEIEALLSA